MKIKKYSELNWWKRLIILIAIGLFVAGIIWLAFCALIFLLDYNVPKSGKGFESIVFGKNSIIYFLISLGVVAGGEIFIYIKYSPKLLGRFKKDREFVEEDLNPRWLSQEELQKKLVVLADGVESTYATWTIAGVQNAVHQNGAKIKEEVSYHILACDKRCLQLQRKKDGLKPTINGEKNIMDLTAGCTVVIGAGRSGKTKQVVKPSILHLLNSKNKSSMLICDLKGDIYKETSKIAEANGFNVLRFNTTNSKCSHSWNPLIEIWNLYYQEYLPNWMIVKNYRLEKEKHPKKVIPNEKISSINKAQEKYLTAKGLIEKKIDVIVNIISPVNKNSKDQFFDKKAQDLIKMYYLLPLDFGIDKENYTFHNISITGLEIENKLTVLQDMLPEWALSKTLSKQFKNINGQDSLMDVRHTANKNLNNFALQEIKDLTSLTDKNIDFKKFIEEPTVIYLSIDTTSNDGTATNSLAVLFMEMLYAYLQEYLNKNALTHFDNPILFIIDEFGNLPKMEFILTIFAGNQGQNIMAMLVLQSATGQINETYNNNQRTTLFDNTQCFILTSGVNPEFAQWLSVKSGSSHRKTLSKSINDDGKMSKNQSQQRMSEIPQEEFANIKSGEEIIIFPNGSKPCKITYKSADKLKWYQEQTLKHELGKDIPYSNPNISEFDFFEDGMNEDIIKLWIKRNNIQGNVEFKKNLAVELLNTIRFSRYWKEEICPNDKATILDKKYKEHGGYPCKALELIGIEQKKISGKKKIKNKVKPTEKISSINEIKTSDDRQSINSPEGSHTVFEKWDEAFFDNQCKKFKATLKKEDFKNIENLNRYKISAFLFILQAYGWNNIERKYFSSPKEVDEFNEKIESNKELKCWIDLYYKNVPTLQDTFDSLISDYQPIIEKAKNITISVFPYLTKLVDMLKTCWMNSDEGVAANGSNQAFLNKLKQVTKIDYLDNYEAISILYQEWCCKKCKEL